MNTYENVAESTLPLLHLNLLELQGLKNIDIRLY